MRKWAKVVGFVVVVVIGVLGVAFFFSFFRVAVLAFFRLEFRTGMVSVFDIVGLRKTACCLCELPCRRKSHSNSNLWHHSTMRLDVFWWWCVEDIFLTCQIFFLPLSSWEEEEKANAIWTNKDYISSTRRTDDLSRVDRKQKITSSFFDDTRDNVKISQEFLSDIL